MTRIQSIELRHLNLPLTKPYALSYRTFESFEPYVVTVCTDDGRMAFGEQHISPGSSSETRDGGWTFLQDRSKYLIGHSTKAAAADLWNHRIQSPVAATALINALDQVNEPERWVHDRSLQIPILTAFPASTPEQIRIELDEKIDLGYRTFKIKVGKDVVEDRQRVQTIQDILGSRGTIRVDANRAYAVKDAIALSQHLDPTICELFEQPCDTHDWEGNGEVAKNSPVPLMLDEPICTMDDIERAATMQGVGFCKVKLKRFGSLEALCKAIEKAHELGLQIVLGDGLGSDINCYLEALVSAKYLHRAGEFNGCFKIQDQARILNPPLKFDDGHLVLEDTMRLTLNQTVIETHTVRKANYGQTEA